MSVEDLNELNVELVRNILYKVHLLSSITSSDSKSIQEYLQDFLNFCMKLDDTTRLLMQVKVLLYFLFQRSSIIQKLLSLEADRHAIRITVNSFGTELSKCDRKILFAGFGNLYPEGQHRLAQCESFDEVRDLLTTYPELRDLASSTDSHQIDRVLQYLSFCINLFDCVSRECVN